ncbi:unnamed protein product [Trichogramma brassicae]|uniref:Uncharacterized protein n=1 Tax=Trichogramma brassicae TaxID=86971 RepID=A0A6H5IL43_9HYME|nr:unnamed protein product [Trichogramma brassicae]
MCRRKLIPEVSMPDEPVFLVDFPEWELADPDKVEILNLHDILDEPIGYDSDGEPIYDDSLNSDDASDDDSIITMFHWTIDVLHIDELFAMKCFVLHNGRVQKRGEVALCGYTLIATEHARLFLLETRPNAGLAAKQVLDAENIIHSAYFNTKLAYFAHHVKTQFEALYRDSLFQRCMLARQIIGNALSQSESRPDIFALAVMRKRGFSAILASEAAHLVSCMEVACQIRAAETCFNELPVTCKGAEGFLRSNTRIFTHVGTPRECSVVFPAIYDIDDVFVAMNPNVTLVQKPSIIQPLEIPTWNYEEIRSFMTSGIYSAEELEKLEDHMAFPLKRQALLESVVRRLADRPRTAESGNFQKVVGRGHFQQNVTIIFSIALRRLHRIRCSLRWHSGLCCGNTANKEPHLTKLDTDYAGPYEIKEVDHTEKYAILLRDGTEKRVHIDKIKHAYIADEPKPETALINPIQDATRRLRHYRSGLRALRRGRRPRQRGSVAQPEQHELSASRAASRRGAGEIHSRAAEQGRGGARRQALLLPDHMSGEEVPSARQQFEGGDRADAFQGARIPDGRARPARHVLQSESSLGLRKTIRSSRRVLWQLDEQLSQELDGIDTIFGNLLAPLSS